jgi:hypothetical protein
MDIIAHFKVKVTQFTLLTIYYYKYIVLLLIGLKFVRQDCNVGASFCPL